MEIDKEVLDYLGIGVSEEYGWRLNGKITSMTISRKRAEEMNKTYPVYVRTTFTTATLHLVKQTPWVPLSGR